MLRLRSALAAATLATGAVLAFSAPALAQDGSQGVEIQGAFENNQQGAGSSAGGAGADKGHPSSCSGGTECPKPAPAPAPAPASCDDASKCGEVHPTSDCDAAGKCGEVHPTSDCDESGKCGEDVTPASTCTEGDSTCGDDKGYGDDAGYGADQVSAVPTGSADAGGGSTSGAPVALVTAGGLTLLGGAGAGAYAMTRRRVSRHSA